ncbi:MAG TPA: HAD-IA family hydrolase [Rhodocyclaceae bacterium]|nr:HAD-IA family hydrolase [Rhodocyclaceae bacterium]
MFEAVLFDLDGTLADTAPDLDKALNRLRTEEGLPPLPHDFLRPFTSQGVRGLLQAGFEIDPEHADYGRLSGRFLEFYAEDICSETRLFDGIPELLDTLEKTAIRWGIVTNKRTRFTTPVVAALELSHRTVCVVSGDTTAMPKPSPLPVLHACELLGCRPQSTLFVGDDRRDIEAGKAAGTRTAAVSYGYLGDGGSPFDWHADFVADHPRELLDYVLGVRRA